MNSEILLWNILEADTKYDIQSTLVISTSLISNNFSSRSEDLVPIWLWKLITGNKILSKRGEIAP